ncbi:MAG: PP2C family protein-serine/threonine phosphatase, partial [Bacteroidota bacterium]
KRIEIARRALQKKVNQATKEIRQQKEEIEQKNKNITSSIEYGQRIQNAILPPKSGIKNVLPDSFVLFKPRDIVSGDFYWFNDDKEHTIVIVADCTGHGVPGAFMSMIGNTLLNEIIKEMKITEPDEILKHLDRHVKNALTQGKEENDTGDGMDISICKIDKKENKLYFAGARNSMVVIYNDKLKIIEANRFAIGGKSFVKRRKRFTTKELPVEKGTCCYLFSDGYSDQTGGANGKKIKSGRFIQLLNDIHKEKMDQQYVILNDKLNKWMDGYTQRDDILVIGFRL